MKKILVLSPHMDDLILSCFDHVNDWLSRGDMVRAITVFSSYNNSLSHKLPRTAIQYMKMSGHHSVHAFTKVRCFEDDLAMKLLSISCYHRLGFVDASFRRYHGKDAYGSYNDIFYGKIRQNEWKIVQQLSSTLSKYSDFDCVVLPLGVGCHIDHVLLNSVGKKLFHKSKCLFYRDYPYGNHWFGLRDVFLSFCEKNRLEMSDRKFQAIQCYKSQLSQLFPKGIPFYDEVMYRQY